MGLLEGLAGQLLTSLGPGASRHSNLLPHDKLTPNGSLPQGGDIFSQGLSMLKGKLF